MSKTYKNISPSKKLRSLKRLLAFILNKSSVNCPTAKQPLSISPQQSISVTPPMPTNAVTFLPPIDIPPTKKTPKLGTTKTGTTSIPPRPVYHPAIINASNAMFAKHPSQLTSEEQQKFKHYKEHKIRIGEPLEEEIIFLPSGGIRTCLNCGEIT